MVNMPAVVRCSAVSCGGLLVELRLPQICHITFGFFTRILHMNESVCVCVCELLSHCVEIELEYFKIL